MAPAAGAGLADWLTVSATYRLLIPQDDGRAWARAGLRVLARGGWAAGVDLAVVHDPAAPGRLEGERVELELAAGRVAGYWIVDALGSRVWRVTPDGSLG